MSWDRPSPAGHPSPGTRGPRGSGALSLPGGLSCLPALGVSDYWHRLQGLCRHLHPAGVQGRGLQHRELYSKWRRPRARPQTPCRPQPRCAGSTSSQGPGLERGARRLGWPLCPQGPGASPWPSLPGAPSLHSPCCKRGSWGGGTGVRVPSCPAGRMELASQEAVRLFTRWSRGLGFLSQQQAALQRDRECPPGPPPSPRTGSLPLVSGSLPASVSQAGLGGVSSSRSHLLPARSQADRGGPVSGEAVGPTSRLLLSPQSPVRTRPSR